TDDLPVGHVDQRLARLGRAVLALRGGERAQLVDAIQVGAGHAVRLTLVEVSAHADEAVRERKQRLGLGEHVQVQGGLVERPWLYAKPGVDDHRGSRSAPRSVTTMSAPCDLSAAAWPARSTPTT